MVQNRIDQPPGGRESAPSEDEITFRFAKDDDGSVEPNSADPRLSLMAVMVANQQSAGFRNYIDLREVKCPDCGASGFNSGWGYWVFTCDAEILSDGEPSEPCGKSPDPTRLGG